MKERGSDEFRRASDRHDKWARIEIRRALSMMEAPDKPALHNHADVLTHVATVIGKAEA